MHNHKECKHKLEFCKHCDIVYCDKCKKEWKYSTSGWTFGSTGVTGGLIGTTPLNNGDIILTTAATNQQHNHGL